MHRPCSRRRAIASEAPRTSTRRFVGAGRDAEAASSRRRDEISSFRRRGLRCTGPPLGRESPESITKPVRAGPVTPDACRERRKSSLSCRSPRRPCGSPKVLIVDAQRALTVTSPLPVPVRCLLCGSFATRTSETPCCAWVERRRRPQEIETCTSGGMRATASSCVAIAFVVAADARARTS